MVVRLRWIQHPAKGFIRTIRVAAKGISFLALILLWAFAPALVLAQQGGAEPPLKNAGPYEIGVQMVRSDLAVGFAQVAVVVLDGATGQPVPDARVVLRTRHAESGDEGRANALNSPGTPARYQARLSLDSPGAWLVSVEVDSSLGKIALEIGSLEVPAPSRFSSGSIVFAGVFGVLILGGLYLWWSTRGLRRQR